MSDVSRETDGAGSSASPSWPIEAERVFSPSRLALAAEFAAKLADDGVLRGLIGPREVPRLWDRHLLNCAVLSEAIAPDSSVCDVGSGAGLPGIVLAIARPDLEVTLLEPLLRRTTFLTEVAERLRLRNVRVVRGRADALHERERFDVVTSRALAPLARLLEWSMPLVDPAGSLLAMKGAGAAVEVEEARAVWTRLGCRRPEVVVLGAAGVSTATVVRVVWLDPTRVSSRPATPARTIARGRRDRRPNRRNRS